LKRIERDIKESENNEIRKSFDKIKFPSQGKSLDNKLIDKLLDNKKITILKGCAEFVYYGDKIIELIEHGTIESLRDGIVLEEVRNIAQLYKQNKNPSNF
jgi:hypothetical protein